MAKAAVIGVFDGVHRGHSHLLAALRRLASERGLEPVAVTFAVHPLAVVNPAAVPPLLLPPERRFSLLRAEGVEPMVLDFTPELRSLTAEEFLKFLRSKGVELLLMGFNNRIGSDRLDGSSPLLAEAARRQGIELLTAPEYPASPVSSSLVREAVSRGEVDRAAELLGRPYSIEGPVVHGRQIGRTIGFPTANIAPAPGLILPPPGVYEARCLGHKAVVNIGRRPTLDNGDDVTIEAHLLGFSGDLYGRTVSLNFVRRLRPERKFPSLDALKTQIAKDIDSVNGNDF